MTRSRELRRTNRPRRILRNSAVGVAGILTVTLGISACGALDVKQQADAAKDNLAASTSASFTFRIEDPQGSIKKASEASDESFSDSNARSLDVALSSSMRITVDPAGDATLGTYLDGAATTPTDTAEALKQSGSMEFTYVHDGTDVITVRSIDGTLYAKVNLEALNTVAGGELPLDQLDSPGLPAGLAPVVNGLKDGKWLSLDLVPIYDKLEKLGGAVPGASMDQYSPEELKALGTKMMEALSGSVSTGDATEVDGATVIAVQVQAKAALNAILDVLADAKLEVLTSDDIEQARKEISDIPDGTVNGSVSIVDEHFTQLAVDVNSIAVLSKDQEAIDGTQGVRVVADINDAAPAITAPASNEVVQLDALVDAALGMLEAQGGLANFGGAEITEMAS